MAFLEDCVTQMLSKLDIRLIPLESYLKMSSMVWPPDQVF